MQEGRKCLVTYCRIALHVQIYHGELVPHDSLRIASRRVGEYHASMLALDVVRNGVL